MNAEPGHPRASRPGGAGGRLGAYALFVALAWLAAACGLNPAPAYTELEATPVDQLPSLPHASYREVAWLSGDLLALLYLPASEVDSPALWKRQIGVYDSDAGTWRQLAVPQPAACYSAWLSALNRLPDGRLGFLYKCNSNDEGSGGFSLMAWNPHTDIFEVIRAFPPSFDAAQYTFAPDMSEFVQVEAPGAGLNERLYRIPLGEGDMERLLPHFQRARTPAWSPDGRLIAFSGTETYPGPTIEAGSPFRDVEALLRFPWDLFLTEPDGSNTRVVLPKLEAGRLKWLPDSRHLSFAGAIGNVEGVWVFDVDTRGMSRVWPRADLFDWSPDGRRLVVIDRPDGDRWAVNQPMIVEVPPSIYADEPSR